MFFAWCAVVVAAFELGVHSKNQAVEAFDKTWRKVWGDAGELLAELVEGGTFDALRDQELGQGFIADTDMVLEFGCDLGNERQELEVRKVVHIVMRPDPATRQEGCGMGSVRRAVQEKFLAAPLTTAKCRLRTATLGESIRLGE
ncbi:hypothetical protein NM208_g17242 [Fusarium decemcellulare]|uniref:Uncharacterized protein n=1 Tax=Fusarium decemcellulare TaxID=57161 RepID=A0ACC1RC24_9HYPO|nr:hypothetical protein NM208_g17242 [Fusarium decemcellulare]